MLPTPLAGRQHRSPGPGRELKGQLPTKLLCKPSQVLPLLRRVQKPVVHAHSSTATRALTGSQKSHGARSQSEIPKKSAFLSQCSSDDEAKRGWHWGGKSTIHATSAIQLVKSVHPRKAPILFKKSILYIRREKDDGGAGSGGPGQIVKSLLSKEKEFFHPTIA